MSENRLTEEQKRMVEDNHSLIYWYINLKGIDEEEWYGILAIELCNAVQSYDGSRGAFSTYYKRCADNRMIKEYEKSNTQSRSHNGIYELSDLNSPQSHPNQVLDLTLEQFIQSDKTGVIRLKMLGYTQVEIANELNISQTTVSRILSRLRKEYEEIDN